MQLSDFAPLWLVLACLGLFMAIVWFVFPFKVLSRLDLLLSSLAQIKRQLPPPRCQCSSCGVNIEFDMAQAGRKVKCPSCGNETALR